MLGYQIGVLAQAVAGALDLDDDGVVKEAIEQRGSNHRITEDSHPIRRSRD